MQTTTELIQQLSENFNQSLSRLTDNRIDAPLAIIYSGESAAANDTVIMNDCKQIWLAARARYICRLKRQNEAFMCIDSDMTEVIPYLDEMYHAPDGVFSHFNQLTVIAIYDTADYNTYQNFLQTYTSDDNVFSQMLELHTPTLVRMVVIRNACPYQQEMRQYLSEQSSHGQCHSVFLFSNVLYNGRYTEISNIYDVIGKIIVCGSTDSLSRQQLDIFGRFGNGYIRTASYIQMERPNKDICATIVRSLLQRLESTISSVVLPEDKILKERLGLDDNRYAIIHEIYEFVRQYFPPDDVWEYFPMNQTMKPTERLSGMLFNEFNDRTMNEFSLFYSEYYESVFGGRNAQSQTIRSEIVKKVHDLLTKNFSRAETYRFLGGFLQKTDAWLTDAVRSEPSPNQTVLLGYVKEYTMMQLERMLPEIYQSEIRNLQHAADNHIRQLQTILQEDIQNVLLQDNSVADYYRNKVDEYLRNYGNELTDKILSENIDREHILENIYDYIV